MSANNWQQPSGSYSNYYPQQQQQQQWGDNSQYAAPSSYDMDSNPQQQQLQWRNYSPIEQQHPQQRPVFSSYQIVQPVVDASVGFASAPIPHLPPPPPPPAPLPPVLPPLGKDPLSETTVVNVNQVAVSSPPKFGDAFTNNNNNKDEEESKKEKKEAEKTVSVRELFKYADNVDIALFVVGAILAAANGVAMPAFSLIFGKLVDIFGHNVNTSRDQLVDKVFDVAVDFLYIGIGTFVCSYGEVALFKISSERQVRRIRTEYLSACLRQEISWYDTNKVGDLTSRITGDVLLIQQGFDKFGAMLHHSATFIAGFVVGFVTGWELTLVILCAIPCLAISGAIVGVMSSRLTKQSADAYGNAGAVVEETLQNQRVVATFGCEQKQCALYEEQLENARKIGSKAAFVNAIGFSLANAFFFAAFALSFWYGGKLIADKSINSKTGDPWTAGDVVAVFFAVVFGGFALGQVQPTVTDLNKGRGAAFKVFQMIERKSKINHESSEGLAPKQPIAGAIELRDLHFAYPSRPHMQILKGLSLSIAPGKKVALVGESGCGKSTIVSFLLRFYDVDSGTVLLDGHDIRQYNVKYLREQIGLVSQEPILFAMSIRDNIALARPSVTEQEIQHACVSAHAHDFIAKLPNGYDTFVGNKGAQLSGGQKQRIAIARAIVRNPHILLLDEATSALDRTSERIVQQALDAVMQGRTAVIIAHRLTTIRDVDEVCVVRDGVIREKGSFDELLEQRGLFTALAARQQIFPGEPGTGRTPATNGITPSTSGAGVRGPRHVGEEAEDEEAAAAAAEAEEKKKKEVADAAAAAAAKAKSKKEKKGDKDDDEDEVEMPELNISLSRIFKMQRSEIHYFIPGFLLAAGNGMVYPIFSLIFAEVLKAFQSADPDTVRSKANFMALMFFLLAIGAFICFGGQILFFSLIGEKLTFRLRSMSFRAIMKKDGVWFDDYQNSPGAVGSRLSQDAAKVQGATSDRFGLVVQNTTTFVAGMVMAFTTGWKLAFLILAAIPLLIAAFAIQASFMNGATTGTKDELGEAGAIIAEAISSLRTIAALGIEQRVRDRFQNALGSMAKEAHRKSHAAGIAFGFSQAVQYVVYFGTLYYGGRLVVLGEWDRDASKLLSSDCTPDLLGYYHNNVDECIEKTQIGLGFGDMMKTFFEIFMAAMGIGESLQFAPNAQRAKRAVNSIFGLIDEPVIVDPSSVEGDQIPPTETDFSVQLTNVGFAYPSRQEFPVFRALNLHIPSGQVTALVGESGGGKSTVMWLIQRLYVPSSGTITIGGRDVAKLNVAGLRRYIGLVGQEPTLFARSIKENIMVGNPGATDQEIEQAAKTANAHEFIAKLPDGYNTFVGEKHTQLSGGQKQRVAIARAVLRNPRILLLDEATSALDSQSERVVQEALEKVMVGRTSIVIAHRLSTIQRAHKIAVLRGGVVAEEGTHDQLIAMGGFYANLAGSHQ